MTTVAQCTGECCRLFPVGGLSPAALERGHHTIEDGSAIVTMLDFAERDTEGRWLYSCRNWDADARDCKAYEQRPAMCVEYPYGRVCEHCGGDGSDPSALPTKATKESGFRASADNAPPSQKPPNIRPKGRSRKEPEPNALSRGNTRAR